jgi:hypothetical protein
MPPMMIAVAVTVTVAVTAIVPVVTRFKPVTFTVVLRRRGAGDGDCRQYCQQDEFTHRHTPLMPRRGGGGCRSLDSRLCMKMAFVS